MMESGWKLNEFQNIIRSVRNIFPGQILSAIICVKNKTNFIGKTSYAQIQIIFSAGKGGRGELCFIAFLR